MIDDLDIMPITVSETRRFLSVWSPCKLDDLGVRRKELADSLERSINRHLGKPLKPELQDEIRRDLMNAAKAFEHRHNDIRFTKADIQITFGNFNLLIEIERSGMPVKTLRALPQAIQNEIATRGSFQIGGRVIPAAGVLVVDDPWQAVNVPDDSGLGRHFIDTFLDTAQADQLDALSSDMFAMSRLFGESDASLRARIQQNIVQVSLGSSKGVDAEVKAWKSMTAAPARREETKQEKIEQIMRDLGRTR